MAQHRSQHIHYATREIDLRFVTDKADADTLAGYVDYSIPWQAIYNQLIETLVDLNIKPLKPLKPLACQSPVDF